MGQICDLDSACFYAYLANLADKQSMPACKMLAETLVAGGQPFPFGPSNPYSTGHSLSSTGASLSSSAMHAGAHLAIQVLQDGPQDVFRDIGCAQVFASACRLVGRDSEAEKTLAWTHEQSKRQQDSVASIPKAEGNTTHPPQVMNFAAVDAAVIKVEMGRLAAQCTRFDVALQRFEEARRIDGWSWSAWTNMCDLGCTSDPSSAFTKSEVDVRELYRDCLHDALISQGFNEELVSLSLAEIRKAGRAYYDEPAAQEGQHSHQEPKDQTHHAGAMIPEQPRVTKRPVTQKSTLPGDSQSFARPGTRPDSGATAKRPRTAAADSTVSAPAQLPPGQTRTIKSTADAKQALGPSSKVKATVGATRQANTLSAARTNEPQRPPSVASSSSKSTTSSTDVVKSPPRRSARVNVTDTVDIPARLASAGVRNAASIGQRSVASTQVGNTAPKKHLHHSEVAAKTPSPALQEPVTQAAKNAMELALYWNAVEDDLLELLRTLAKAYSAVRNGHGRLALALLRPRGPVLTQDAESVKKESAMMSRQKNSSAVPLRASIQFFSGLDDAFRNSVEIRCLIARAYHGLGQYHEADKHFEYAHYISPMLLRHMDIYSLSLFHLQRDAQLSSLADEMALIDPHSCAAHIAAGNAFALQREHLQALQSFQRACLAAPGYAYAHTLAGYEALELGHHEQSVRYFREAIKIDERHWNALAGLGQLYLHSDKREAAAYYYLCAVSICPGNAVLWDIYGRVLATQGKLTEAEQAFARSIRLEASSAMSHVKLAEVLLRQDKQEQSASDRSREAHKTVLTQRRQRAHEHLLEAVKQAPEEAHVHLMLAKSYMDMGAGAFAKLHHSNRSASGHEGDNGDGMDSAGSKKHDEVSVADLALIGTAGPAHLMVQQHQIRATGHATLPTKYHAEIAKHLCAAIDLNPRLGRYVKAMGEGARAALRGAAARMMGDVGGADATTGMSMLIDNSGMSAEGGGGGVGGFEAGESMLTATDADDVLEDEEYIEDSGALPEEEDDQEGGGSQEYGTGGEASLSNDESGNAADHHDISMSF